MGGATDPGKPAASGNGPRRGPSDDFGMVVTEHYQAVYRYAFRLTGRVSDAEDVTQQTFLVAQEKLHQLRDGGKVLGWLFAVARSCFLKSRRRQRPISAAELEMNVSDIPEDATDDEIDREQLQMAINGLPDDFRLVLVMFYFEELSYKQIAAELQRPIGTVMSQLSRAKGRLRRALLRSQSCEPVRPATVSSQA